MLKLSALIIVFVAIFSACSAHAQDVTTEPVAVRKAQISGTVLNVDVTTPQLTRSPSGKAFWQWEFSQPGASYLRVHFQPVGFQGQQTSAVLSFWDQSGRLVSKLAIGDLARHRASWSDAVEGEYVLMTLRVKNPEPDTRIIIDRVAVQNETSVALSTVGDDNTEDIIRYRDNPRLWGLQGSVARLLLIQDGLPAWCTGFMIADNVLMTNHHCVKSQTECEDLKVQFNYYVTEAGNKAEISQFNCIGFNPQHASEQFDYALVRLAGSPGVTFGIVDFNHETYDVTSNLLKGSDVIVIQHPAGKPKKIAKTNCLIEDVPVDGRREDSDFAHSCDTEGGSSGSPVFDTNGRLVGLHHYGFDEGGIWSRNRATTLSVIAADLKARGITFASLASGASSP